MAVDKSSWSNARHGLYSWLDENKLHRYGEVDEFVAGLTEEEVKLVVDAFNGTDPFRPCYMTMLDQHRARKAAAGMAETAFVAGHGGLASAVEAVVEADRQESI